LKKIEQAAYDLVLLDIWLPGIDGIETLRRLREKSSKTHVIIISGHATIATAVTATKLGAYDFIEKPLSLEHTLLIARNALSHRRLQQANDLLRNQLEQRFNIVGESVPTKALRKQIAIVAPTNSRILIYGESGTGKELVSRNIHFMSQRAGAPFVEVNCAAIPEELIESELFGHTKGSFTGASDPKKGKFELADGGTLFLDEIGTVPLALQSKLLRVLQTGDVERVGSSKARHVDVRVVSATNANLQQEVAEGRFREDLLFRLNTIEIQLPALRDRREDIPALATHFLRRHATRYRKTLHGFDAGAMQLLLGHPWPGNIRELDHAVERAVLLAQGDQVRAGDLGLRAASSASTRLEDLPLEDVEKMLIQKALSRYDGNVSRAAQALGLSRSALYRRIASYGL